MKELLNNLLVCKTDGQPLDFYSENGISKDKNQNQNLVEGILVCHGYPSCKCAYLVTEGIIITLQNELMSESDRKLLASRLNMVHGKLTT